jgi:hypothetical protein
LPYLTAIPAALPPRWRVLEIDQRFCFNDVFGKPVLASATVNLLEPVVMKTMWC